MLKLPSETSSVDIRFEEMDNKKKKTFFISMKHALYNSENSAK